MSFSHSDDDSQQRFALGFLFALIALVVSTVVGVVVYQRGIAHGPAKTAGGATPVAAMVPVVLEEDVARVVVENGVVKFYFASRSEEHTSELQSQSNLVCRLLLEKKKRSAVSWALRARRCRSTR